MVLFPAPRRSRANALGERPYDSSTIGYWPETWLDQFAVADEHGKPFDPARVFPYAFRHTYAQLRADVDVDVGVGVGVGVPLGILQVLMAHQDPSTTQVYYRPSHPPAGGSGARHRRQVPVRPHRRPGPRSQPRRRPCARYAPTNWAPASAMAWAPARCATRRWRNCASNETQHSQPAAKQRPPCRHSATSTSG
ncbi:hypothetical protein [Streptomyces sp. NPDC059743]|uniref:hypothetical protein n=1 Tax=Streptomyces sp. NPDC059743 TaxID=3346928 RepID=UPI00364632FC